MSAPKTHPGNTAILEREDLPKLIEVLQAKGYRVVGPTIRGGAIVYDQLGSIADLPCGWGDEQEGGKYCLRQRPDAELHGKIGELLAARGRIQDAIAHYRAALRLQPELWPVLNNLALILATDANPANRDGRAAVQFAEQACVLTGQREAGVVTTLAAAYAEAGRFPDAVATAQRARALAQAAGDAKLAERNRELLRFYESGRAFHEGKTQPAGPQ